MPDPSARPSGALTVEEALAFEAYAGVTVIEAAAQLRGGTPSAKVCVASMWIARSREESEVTPEAVIASYASYTDLVADAAEQLTAQTADGE